MKDAICYKVTVTAVVERTEMAGKEWARASADPASPYAYTPEIEKTVRRDVLIFEQSVDKLDMTALVLVVNGIRPFDE